MKKYKLIWYITFSYIFNFIFLKLLVPSLPLNNQVDKPAVIGVLLILSPFTLPMEIGILLFALVFEAINLFVRATF